MRTLLTYLRNACGVAARPTSVGVATSCLLALTGACKWTDFDDLEKDTWVTSSGKPNSDSTDYGVALQRGNRTSATGGKIIVIGAGQAQYTELEFSSEGDSDTASTALKLNTQFGIGNLDQQPILLADPTTDDISLVVNSGGASVAVLTGTGGVIAHQVFGPEQPDAATYMLPPPRADQPSLPVTEQVLVAVNDTVYGTFVANVPNPQPKCQLVDEANTPVTVRAMAPVRVTSTTYDDVLVWGVTGTTSKLLLYPGGVFNGGAPVGTCNNNMQAPLGGSTSLAISFVPAKGSQIVMADGTHFLLVGHKEVGSSDSFLAYYGLNAGAKSLTAIGTPSTVPNLRTATVLATDVGTFVAAGYPTAEIDTKHVTGGQVLLYGLDANGISAAPVMTLFDAQPSNDQQFGRALVSFPFNGHNILAVSADNEIFTYFKIVTPGGQVVYDETRSGR